MKTEIITNCLDLLAGFELLAPTQQTGVFLSIIDKLGSYPKPQKKYDTIRAKDSLISAYLFVSNVRNACKLGELGAITPIQANQTILGNLENALTELLNK